MVPGNSELPSILGASPLAATATPTLEFLSTDVMQVSFPRFFVFQQVAFMPPVFPDVAQ
jgi:hypothetical protein